MGLDLSTMIANPSFSMEAMPTRDKMKETDKPRKGQDKAGQRHLSFREGGGRFARPTADPEEGWE